jgi:Raf kinase inhibitor-like YbhB/YbcL family protein
MKSLTLILALSLGTFLMAQPPAGKGGGAPGGGKGGGKGPARPVLSVSSPAWPDGGEVPMENAGRGGNKSPEFAFNWSIANAPAPAPMELQTYAVIFHDIENSSNRTTVDTLHWSAFNIPGTAKGLPAGLGGGDLPDGTRNGPGIRAGGGAPAYFGPGAGVGPFHHYVFEFYALDTKLDLPATATRDELMKAMDTHIIGKAAYVGRFHAVQ